MIYLMFIEMAAAPVAAICGIALAACLCGRERKE